MNFGSIKTFLAAAGPITLFLGVVWIPLLIFLGLYFFLQPAGFWQQLALLMLSGFVGATLWVLIIAILVLWD